MPPAPKPPANYWATMIALASLALTALQMVTDAKSSLERRLCRLEALNNMGECKR